MPEFPTGDWEHSQTLVVAHRGASHKAPENTLAAFRLAADIGADAVELDVHLSADNIPVVIHNATVDATTDGTGTVRQMSLAHLKTLQIAPSADKLRGNFHQNFEVERIPTLEEVLNEVGQRLLINIEFKDYALKDTGLETAVDKVLRRTNMLDRVWFSSFNPFALRRARSVTPEVPCGMLYGAQRQFPPFLNALRHRWFAFFTPHEALHPEHTIVTPALIQNAHRRGLRVATWTLDDSRRAKQFATWGIDAIITNVPDQILAAIGHRRG
jgi:glycerophosphoryl diester phosphodiesterase